MLGKLNSADDKCPGQASVKEIYHEDKCIRRSHHRQQVQGHILVVQHLQLWLSLAGGGLPPHACVPHLQINALLDLRDTKSLTVSLIRGNACMLDSVRCLSLRARALSNPNLLSNYTSSKLLSPYEVLS